MTMNDFYLAVALAVGAALYSAVGHGGASAYIAIMSFSGMSYGTIKPTALALNIVVSALASYRYIRARQFEPKLFIYVSLAAIPMAFLGGYIVLPKHIYNPIVGVILLFAAVRFFMPAVSTRAVDGARFNIWNAGAAGAVIGLLSGLTGTGGGIFLSPLVIFLGWTTARNASGTAALFILVNSVAGLLGNIASVANFPSSLPSYMVAVVAGGYVGTAFGVKYSTEKAVRYVLACVLIVAGFKFLLT